MAIPKVDFNQVEKYKKVVDDFWGKHNLTTRIITLSSTLLLIILVIIDITGKNIPNFDLIFKTLADMVLYITLVIIIGVNGATKILEILQSKNK